MTGWKMIEKALQTHEKAPGVKSVLCREEMSTPAISKAIVLTEGSQSSRESVHGRDTDENPPIISPPSPDHKRHKKISLVYYSTSFSCIYTVYFLSKSFLLVFSLSYAFNDLY